MPWFYEFKGLRMALYKQEWWWWQALPLRFKPRSLSLSTQDLHQQRLWGPSKGSPSLVDALQKVIPLRPGVFQEQWGRDFSASNAEEQISIWRYWVPCYFWSSQGSSFTRNQRCSEERYYNLRYIDIPEHSSFRKWDTLGFIFNIMYPGT